MLSRIQVLSEDLVNKIAAGEVVERPASVVKELIENSIDAGTTQIVVEIQDAGKKLIRVSDNGSGMSKEEISLSVERHSTSKIRELDDLFNITSLGFRGEALPSIASVSKIKISSSPKDGEGHILKIEGGKNRSIEPAGLPQGTTVEIKDLFFNTPARKKFMKSPGTESGHIGNIISKYALANPQIVFKFVSDGKPLLSTSGSGKPEDAVIAVYGLELMKALVPLSSGTGAIKLRGFINKPNISRVGRDYINFFLNGRYIYNGLLNRALQDSYRTLIPNNRFPIGIIFIEMDPKKVDVNVHPTKREVKFVNTQQVMDAVRTAVKQALGNQNIRPAEKAEWSSGMADILFDSPPQAIEMLEMNLEVTAIQPYLPVYQYKNTYIIATDGEDLVLIDQHAAHERILYDRLLQSWEGGSDRQNLLIPENMDIPAADALILETNLDYFKKLGFDLEVFGKTDYLVRAVPAVMGNSFSRQFLMDMIGELKEAGKSASLELKKERLLKYTACKAAIKAGDKLSSQEMSRLIKDLFSTTNPLTCPHGRPTIIKLSERDLQKWFKRA